MNNLTRKLLCLCIILTLTACEKAPSAAGEGVQSNTANAQIAADANAGIEAAFANKQSDVQVSGQGVVVRLLPDDNKGSRHQRFLVRINDRQTLLFAHNIDLAERVPLQAGDHVSFNGEYVYNPKGGIVHWTHHDPQGQHQSGWLMLQGKKYQ